MTKGEDEVFANRRMTSIQVHMCERADGCPRIRALWAGGLGSGISTARKRGRVKLVGRWVERCGVQSLSGSAKGDVRNG